MDNPSKNNMTSCSLSSEQKNASAVEFVEVVEFKDENGSEEEGGDTCENLCEESMENNTEFSKDLSLATLQHGSLERSIGEETIVDSETNMRTEEFSTDRLTDRQFYCEQCGVIFSCSSHIFKQKLEKSACEIKGVTNLKYVQNGEASDSCRFCGKTFPGKGFPFQYSYPRKRPRFCIYCGKLLLGMQCPLAHIKTHIEKPSAAFLVKGCEETRAKAKRRNARPCICEHCGKSFASSGSLKMHVNQHTNSSSFSCEVCASKFTRKSALRRHAKRHTGDRSHSCELCGKLFYDASGLVNHARVHSGEKPFSCNLCERSFAEKSSLRKHLKTHTGVRPYSCDLCGKSFTSKKYSLVHQRIHSNERPFCCEVCGKCFVQKYHLVVHGRTHTGERPHICEVCGKSFSQRGPLIRHNRRKHST